MLNAIFVALLVSAVMTAAFNGTMPAVNKALFDSARTAVNIALGLIGEIIVHLHATRRPSYRVARRSMENSESTGGVDSSPRSNDVR